MNRSPKIVCVGEILWDIFPSRKVIGGAPLNVALRFHRQGHKTAMVSRIGRDSLGMGVKKFLHELQFPFTGIQEDEQLPTGEVLVQLDTEGTASYTILEPVAWDAIELTSEAINLVSTAEVFLFGSLVCRRELSRETLFQLLELAPFSVFDVNLRVPYYSMELLETLLQKSDFVKMNDEELLEICRYFGCTLKNLEEQAIWLKDNVGLDSLCITKGAHGAILIHEGKQYGHQGFSVKVKDTVGAGDSFLATLIGALLFLKKPPNDSLKRACAVGALVASKAGANCVVTESEIQGLIFKAK